MVEVMKARPAYVRFVKQAFEDRAASLSAGHSVSKDVVMAHITSPGSRDTVVRNAAEWLAYLADQVRDERFPDEWYQGYKRAYERFLEGEELPPEGTPIKTWPVLTPAQIQNLIAHNIYTVEDLASINEEAKAGIGMGAIELQKKAQNWLQAANDVGKVTQKITALEIQVKQLIEQNERQTGMIQELKSQLKERAEA